jgi:hypothetical protein
MGSNAAWVAGRILGAAGEGAVEAFLVTSGLSVTINAIRQVRTVGDSSASPTSRVLAGGALALTVIGGAFGAWASTATEAAEAAGPAARFLVAPGGATIETGLSAAELLVPNGVRIGEAGASSSIRVIQGGSTEAGMLFEQLSAGGTPVAGSYPGTLVNLGSGGSVGLRTVATGTGARLVPAVTMDVNIPGIAIRELKFIP